jgi:hypothetical protein
MEMVAMTVFVATEAPAEFAVRPMISEICSLKEFAASFQKKR